MPAKRRADLKQPAAARKQSAAFAPAPAAQERVQSAVFTPAPAAQERKKLAAADFFSALQRNLDALQRQLARGNNTFADFVVKEFKVDAAVQIIANDLGVLQFVLADDAMASQSVSRVSLTLAGVAKIPDEAPPQSMAKADLTVLADLAWVPPQIAAHLAQYEVKTASEFLGLVADARFATQIASLLKVERAEIGRWANQMRLLELPGMTMQDVRLLGEVGVNAAADLAQLSEETIGEVLKKAKTLTKEMLVKWREAAKQALL